MNLGKLDLNLFLVFDTICQEGSLTAAAAKLHLSQPAVSHALARLREHLGDALFVRQARRMVPTPYARQLAPAVRSALDSLQSGLQGPQAFAPGHAARHFTVGMSDVMEALALPALMAELLVSAPGVSLHSIRIERHEMANALRSGRVDLVVDVALPAEPDIRNTRLMLDRLVVVGREDHPALASRALALNAYLDASHVLVSARRRGLGIEDLELSRIGLKRRIALRCRHYFAACCVVSRTDLLLTMPEQYARLAQHHFEHQWHAFPVNQPELDAHLYWHASADADPTNRWLRERVIEISRKELAAQPGLKPA